MFTCRGNKKILTRCFSYKPAIADVKKLRSESQAPMKQVREALIASCGDFPAAFEWLRKQGIASATKKAGRATAQGLIGCSDNAMVEINSETDFVAMNQEFHKLVLAVSDAVAADNNNSTDEWGKDQLMASLVLRNNNQTLAEAIPELIGKVGENVSARRACKFQPQDGIVTSYLHNSVAPGLGRAGALLSIEYPVSKASEEQKVLIESLGRRLAMHIVAAKPLYLSPEEIPEEVLAKEKNFLMEQIKDTNKPANILEKMVTGRLNKFYAEVTLLNQDHMVEEGNPKIGKFLEDTSKKLGFDVKLSGFKRYQVGEDIEA